MTHVARGVDDDGTLNVDVVMSGRVPELPPDVPVTVLPYTEQYIQTGPGLSLSLSLSLSVCVCVSVSVCQSVPLLALSETLVDRSTWFQLSNTHRKSELGHSRTRLSLSV